MRERHRDVVLHDRQITLNAHAAHQDVVSIDGHRAADDGGARVVAVKHNVVGVDAQISIDVCTIIFVVEYDDGVVLILCPSP